MQWDKVKNILIAILLTINLFLLGNLAVRGWQSHRRTSELEANLRTLVSARGMQLDTAFSFPEDITLPELSLDRSRADEEKIAAAMLGEHAERTEQEDGTVRFESDKGTLEWQADGNVKADYTLTESAPTSAAEALEQARRLCSRWGFQAEQASWTAEDTVVTLTGAVAGLPVHNRRLTLDFSAGDGSVSLVGLWSFGTPYTTANGICEWRYRLPNTPANIDAGQMAFTINLRHATDPTSIVYSNQYLLRYQVVQDSAQVITAGRLNMSGGDIIPSDAVSANQVTRGARENRFTVSAQTNWSLSGDTRSKTVTLKAANGYRFLSASDFSVEGANCVTA